MAAGALAIRFGPIQATRREKAMLILGWPAALGIARAERMRRNGSA
jgi:hypothetical protein